MRAICTCQGTKKVVTEYLSSRRQQKSASLQQLGSSELGKKLSQAGSQYILRQLGRYRMKGTTVWHFLMRQGLPHPESAQVVYPRSHSQSSTPLQVMTFPCSQMKCTSASFDGGQLGFSASTGFIVVPVNLSLHWPVFGSKSTPRILGHWGWGSQWPVETLKYWAFLYLREGTYSQQILQQFLQASGSDLGRMWHTLFWYSMMQGSNRTQRWADVRLRAYQLDETTFCAPPRTNSAMRKTSWVA